MASLAMRACGLPWLTLVLCVAAHAREEGSFIATRASAPRNASGAHTLPDFSRRRGSRKRRQSWSRAVALNVAESSRKVCTAG